MENHVNTKAVLVVSFGTSYEDAFKENILPAEEALAAAFPDRKMYRAFGSRMIIKKLKNRDNISIDTVEEALKRMADEGVKDLLVQPTYIIHGIEYDDLKARVAAVKDCFETVRMGEPLMALHEDYCAVSEGLLENFGDVSADTALVFMGHGTEHFANAAYPALQHYFSLTEKPVFVGTVEGFPAFENVLAALKKEGLKKARLVPFMLVAGDHAKNDMAGDEDDSWKNMLKAEGIEAECILKGLGSLDFSRKLFVKHAEEAKAL